jgi:Flp pilus assembly protein TadD
MGTGSSVGRRAGAGRCFRGVGAAILVASLTTACTNGKPNLDLLSAPGASAGSAKDVDTAGLMRIAKAAEANESIVDAAGVYGRIIAREPSAVEPRIQLGGFLLRRGDLDGAEEAFRGAKEVAPDSADVQVGLARVLVARDRFEEAATALAAVLKREPTNALALGSMGLAKDGLGLPADAQGHYRQALKVEPGNPVVRNNLGLSLARSGQYDQAIKLLQKLANEPGAEPRYRETLARVIAMRDAKRQR